MYNTSGLASSAIGGLLRKAQELKLQSPLSAPVSAEEGSPIRDQVQGPIDAPESMGSDKITSLKGEMSQAQELIGPSTDASQDIIAPSLMGNQNPAGPVGPIAPVMPTEPSGIIQPGEVSQPSQPQSQPSVQPTNVSKPASLPRGTLIASSAPKNTGIYDMVSNSKGGSITQGKTNNNTAKIAGAGSALARGASAISRLQLGIASLIPQSVLNKIKEGIGNPLNKYQTKI